MSYTGDGAIKRLGGGGSVDYDVIGSAYYTDAANIGFMHYGSTQARSDAGLGPVIAEDYVNADFIFSDKELITLWLWAPPIFEGVIDNSIRGFPGISLFCEIAKIDNNQWLVGVNAGDKGWNVNNVEEDVNGFIPIFNFMEDARWPGELMTLMINPNTGTFHWNYVEPDGGITASRFGTLISTPFGWGYSPTYITMWGF